MVSAINSALSGLAASTRRIEVSADNIANQFSTKSLVNGRAVDQPYVPKRVEQVSLAGGGIQARVVDVNPPTATIFSPESVDADANGSVTVPNVDLPTEMVNQKIASHAYKANLNTIKVADEMEKSLLDILS